MSVAEKLAELFGDTEPKPVAQPTPEPTPAPSPAPAATIAPVEPVKPEAPKPEPGFVPIAAVLDEREKRQAAERERDELRRQRQQPEQVPSVHENPEAAFAYQQEQTDRALTSARFDVSETMATEKHGAEAVKAAMDWGLQRSQESPAFAAEYLKQRHPIDWAVRQHKREQFVSEIGDDREAYIRREAAKLGLVAPAAPQGAQPAPAAPQPVAQPKPAAPSPSLASAPSAGGATTPVYQQPKVLERLFGPE